MKTERFLTPKGSYDEIRAAFRWNVPERYNMAYDVCDRHAADGGTALIYVDTAGKETRYAFRDIRRASSQLAHVLAARRLPEMNRPVLPRRGKPLAARRKRDIHHRRRVRLDRPHQCQLIRTPQLDRPVDPARRQHLAVRLITDSANLPKIEAIRERLPALETVILTDGPGGDVDFWSACGKARDDYPVRDTSAEDPCLLIYTSGTTGQPKGALHAHRAMHGHMPSMEWYHEFYPLERDLFWTPADWAWIGGLMDLLMPAWFHGVPVLAFRAPKFDPEQAFEMIARHGQLADLIAGGCRVLESACGPCIGNGQAPPSGAVKPGALKNGCSGVPA